MKNVQDDSQRDADKPRDSEGYGRCHIVTQNNSWISAVDAENWRRGNEN